MADGDAKPVVLKDENGEIVTVPPEQVNDALQQGYSPATPQEYQQHVWKAKHETFGQQAATLAEGVAQGVVPFAPKLEAGLGISPIDEQQARREANPGLATTGRIAGGIGQAVAVAAATGGVGEAAELGAGGLEGASALSPAAEATEAVSGGTAAADAAAAAGGSPGAVSAAADTAAAAGPQTVADASQLGGYIAQGTAGAANSGTEYINESELGDHDFNGEALGMQVGLGALLGVAGEAGINILGQKVLPPVIRSADGVIDAAREKLRGAFSAISDKINRLEPGTTGSAWDAIFAGAKRFGAAVAEKIADSLDQIGDRLTAISKAHETSFRPDEAARNLADVPMQQAAPHVANVAAVMDHAKSQLDQLAEKNGYAGGLLKKLTGVSDDFAAAVAKGVDSEDLHKATLEAKQRLGDIAFGKNAGVKTGEEALADESVKRVWQATADTLKNPEAFGAAQAGRNTALDVATRRKINAAKQVAKDFGIHAIDLDSGRNELSMKPSKILASLKADPINSQEKLAHLQDYLDATKNYVDEVKISAGTAGATVPGGDDIRDLLDTVTNARAAGEAYRPVAELLRRARDQPPVGLGAFGAAPLAGAALHMAGIGLGPIAPVVGAIAAIRAPVNAMQAMAKIAQTAAATRSAIGSGVKAVFGNVAERTAVTGVAAASLRGRTIRSLAGAAAGNDFDKQAKHISALASNQNLQMNNLADNTSSISKVAPQTTQSLQGSSIRALQTLFEALPKNPAQSSLASDNKGWKPSLSQISDWNDTHEAILKPDTYMEHLRDGTANPKAWAALQAAYPAWTSEVQKQTVDYLASHPNAVLNQSQKFAASMLVGSPVSPSVAPDQIAFQQSMFAAAPPPGSGRGARGRSTQGGLDKLTVGERSAFGSHGSKQ